MLQFVKLFFSSARLWYLYTYLSAFFVCFFLGSGVKKHGGYLRTLYLEVQDTQDAWIISNQGETTPISVG